MHYFVSFKISKMTSMSLLSIILTFGTISAVHFHHLSNLVICVTRVHVIGDFCHIKCRFSGTRYSMPRETYKFRLSRNSTKLNVLARFCEMIFTEITILPFFRKLKFSGVLQLEKYFLKILNNFYESNVVKKYKYLGYSMVIIKIHQLHQTI